MLLYCGEGVVVCELGVCWINGIWLMLGLLVGVLVEGWVFGGVFGGVFGECFCRSCLSYFFRRINFIVSEVVMVYVKNFKIYFKNE